jgi:glycosyltransferase involved in cell wall biosynthesis
MSSRALVVPVYGNEATIPALVERIGRLAAGSPEPLQAVFVIDGTRDASAERLLELLPGAGFPARMVWHSRNFGALAAVRTGLAEADADHIATMAADLQEPERLYADFFAALESGECDVAVGVRTARADAAGARAASNNFWRLYRRLVQPEMPAGGMDVFACTRQVRDVLVSLRESNSSLVGLLIWIGFRRREIPYERAERPAGRSAWTLGRKLRYMADSIYSFTDLPITLLLATGITGVIGSLLLSLAVLVGWLLGAIRVAGYTPLMLTLLIGVSLVLSGLGIVGSYVWRTYENSKLRPPAIVMTVNANPGAPARAEAEAAATARPRSSRRRGASRGDG